MARRSAAFAFALLLATLPAAAAEPVCDESSILTLLGTDTSSDRSLFALTTPTAGLPTWLIVVDGRAVSARLLPDTLGGLRTGASHGPGPFLGATHCGVGCLQPVRLEEAGWAPLGEPIRQPDVASVHFTYDGDGAPWATFHSLAQRDGLVDVTAFLWNGASWKDRGRLLVQAVGSPAAAPDPGRGDAILVGSGRFLRGAEPAVWVPALPAPRDSPGGQVLAVAGAAAYVTFDSRLYTSLDGGSTWFLDRWKPWPGGGEQPDAAYWIDLPAASERRSLPTLWYDERQPDSPVLHLARWSPRSGWSSPAALPLGPGSMPVDQVVSTESGRWLLLGRCGGAGRDAGLEALVLEPGATTPRRASLRLETGWLP